MEKRPTQSEGTATAEVRGRSRDLSAITDHTTLEATCRQPVEQVGAGLLPAADLSSKSLTSNPNRSIMEF